MAKIIEGLVDATDERLFDDDDAGLRHLEQNNRQLSLQINAVLELLWEQYRDQDDLLDVTHAYSSEIAASPPAGAADPSEAPREGDSSANSHFQPQAFQTFVDVLLQLERVAVEDFMAEDFFFAFLHRFLLKYAPVFVAEPQSDAQWRARLEDEVAGFVRSKSDQKLEHLFFLLRNDGVCDLLVFNVADASFYFYENESRTENVALARELVFFLRHLLRADQMVHAVCAADVVGDSLFAAEMLLKIQFNAVDRRLERPMLSLTQIVNLPSYSDMLAVIVVGQFLIGEINEVERVLMAILFGSSSLRGSDRKRSVV